MQVHPSYVPCTFRKLVKCERLIQVVYQTLEMPVWNLQNNILLKTVLRVILHQFACDKKIVSVFLSVNKGQMSIWMMK
jgi:hypothetical protein